MKNRNEIVLVKEIVEKYKETLPSDTPMNDRINHALKYLDTMLQETENLMVETPMGTIIAYKSSDPDDPGILIDLHRQGCKTDAPLCMTEYTETEGDAEGPHLITRIWKDVCSDEYTDRVIHEKLNEFFMEDADN